MQDNEVLILALDEPSAPQYNELLVKHVGAAETPAVLSIRK